MNNQEPIFSQGSQCPSQQPPRQQGFMPPVQTVQNMRYPANKPPRAPGELAKGCHIAMIALGGTVAFLSLFKLINCFYYCFRSSSYEVSNFAYPMNYITLSAALIFIVVEKLIDPQRKGEKSGLRMGLYIAALSVSGLTALLGLVHLFDNIGRLVKNLNYAGSFRVEYYLGSLADSLFILAGCAVVILYFVFRLIDVVKLRKSMQAPRPYNNLPYGMPMQQPVPQQPQSYPQYVPQQQPFVQPQQNGNNHPQA